MKELSIEEKAKAYDEALERAEKALEVLGTDKCEGARQILSLFPELKESEDERIRERLIEFFKDWGKTRSHCWSISISDILAWLEKQR